ncbi:MAG: biotin/lipoyl-binding carrier protein [Actinomycetes bacterium]
MAEVRAEITANVWKVNVSVGSRVAAGDELAILESMKMAITVESPFSGVVTELHVAPDAQIREGDLLCVIAPDEEA